MCICTKKICIYLTLRISHEANLKYENTMIILRKSMIPIKMMNL